MAANNRVSNSIAKIAWIRAFVVLCLFSLVAACSDGVTEGIQQSSVSQADSNVGGGEDSVNSTNSEDSSNAQDPVLEITLNPSDVIVDESEEIQLFVEATGSDLSYQWRKDGVILSGEQSAALLIPQASPLDAGVYDVVVSDGLNSVESLSALVTVNAAPVVVVTPVQIVGQPSSISVTEGGAALFTVSATGSGPITYQWFKGGEILVSQVSEELRFENVSLADAGIYRVQVSNAIGVQTSTDAVLVVSEVTEPVSIINQPESLVVDEGTTVEISVAANGGGVLQYQWYKDGVTLPNQTSAVMRISDVTLEQSGIYTVEVSNDVSSQSSSSAMLLVNEVIASVDIVSQPNDVTVDEGQQAQFQVEATGGGELSYQWYKDDEVLPNETSSGLTIGVTSLTDIGDYSVEVSNEVGVVLSSSATLMVNEVIEPVSIVVNPLDVSVDEGQMIQLSVSAIGGGELSYQWYKGGVEIAGASTSVFEISDAQLSDAGEYSVEVSNSVGGLRSSLVLVTVNELEVSQSVLLEWSIPEQRADGSALELYEIDSYVINYGADASDLSDSIIIEGASNNTAEVSELPSGVYYFSILTIDTEGQQSIESPVISIEI